MITLFTPASSIVREVTGRLSALQLQNAGSHTPTFPTTAGQYGRQWLFLQYNIENVNPFWTFVGLTINGEANGNDQLNLTTADGGLSSISYTAAHYVNNRTDGTIFFTWAGGGASLTSGSLYYSIIYRDVN